MRRRVVLAFALNLIPAGAVPVMGQAAAPSTAVAQPQSLTPAERLAQGLAANPLTAPYRIKIVERKGRLVLQGKVGSTVAHDAAVRTGIAMRLPITDELVTDTLEAARAAVVSDGPAQLMPNADVQSNRTYVYPEPLFGRLDEPFAGMEPPILSYPPDWAAIVARRSFDAKVVAATNALPRSPLPRNTVEVSIDPLGYALLRGNVPTNSDRDQVAQEISQTPGVSGVINRITTSDAPALARRRPVSDTPPPPPRPAPPRASAARPVDDEPPSRPVVVESRRPSPLQSRVNQGLQRVPELRGVGVEASEVAPGVIWLKGKVAGPKEAMLAYRSVQKTVGVTAVSDSLEFPTPEESKRNPLTIDADPADLEPFLTAQISKNLGEAGRVERLTAAGDRIDVQIALDREADRARAEASLRSMPILRGFKVEPSLKVRP